ncbi:hypothetical protein BC629DRAFT_1454256 [Irpex lacteus]|nr:hypothetical protein BC629DRAFT_1454256 [Irpex lacteus]
MSLFFEATLSCGKHIYAWLVSTVSSHPPHLRITLSLVLYCSTDLSLLSPHLYENTVLSRFVMFTLSTCSLLLALATPIFGAPTGTSFQQQNGLDAQKLNAQFATLKSTDSCTEGTQACVEESFAQCVGGTWQLTPCSPGTSCFALPLVNKAGTSLSCDTQADVIVRMQAAGVDASVTGDGNSTGTSSSASQSAPAATSTFASETSSVASAASPSASSTDDGDDGDDGDDCSDGGDDTTTTASAVPSESSSPTASVSAATPTASSDDDGNSGDESQDIRIDQTGIPSDLPIPTGYTPRNYQKRAEGSPVSSSAIISGTPIEPSGVAFSGSEEGGVATVTLITTIFVTAMPSAVPTAAINSFESSAFGSATVAAALPPISSATDSSATFAATSPTAPTVPSVALSAPGFVTTIRLNQPSASAVAAGSAVPAANQASASAAVAPSSAASSRVISSSSVPATSVAATSTTASASSAITSAAVASQPVIDESNISFLLTATVGQLA